MNVQPREQGRYNFNLTLILLVTVSCLFLFNIFLFNFSVIVFKRVDNNSLNKGRSMDVIPSQLATDKTDGTVALVKSGSEKAKTTPAGEYLTAALNDFDPEQYDSLAAISDGANKLLMLVCLVILSTILSGLFTVTLLFVWFPFQNGEEEPFHNVS